MCKKLEEKLAFHSAPALCGIKASNLINIKKEDIKNLSEEIEELNKNHNPKVYFDFLSNNSNNYLILVYRKEKLEEQLLNENNMKFLEDMGYERSNDILDYIYELKRRIKYNEKFPHEIGVFLGYDLEDTLEFINGNKKPLLKGVWNVYSNEKEKEMIFDKYNRCKNCVLRLVNKGFSLENFMR
ncbi:MAG: DUF3793 family protein [bacterium]|nr:DUF3793 family protein [bacterium]